MEIRVKAHYTYGCKATYNGQVEISQTTIFSPSYLSCGVWYECLIQGPPMAFLYPYPRVYCGEGNEAVE